MIVLLGGSVVQYFEDALSCTVNQSSMRLRGLNVRMVRKQAQMTHRSTECEREGLHARIEKLDLEQPIGDWRRLANQLIQPLLGDYADTLIINVDTVSGADWLSIDQHPKPHRGPWRGRSHDKMEIAGVEAIGDRFLP
jgi:hypothetical protein